MSSVSEMYPYKEVPINLPWPDRVCCDAMLRYRTLNSECEQHGYNCPDRPISWFNNHYHIRSPNGEYRIKFCPWCSRKLDDEVKYPKKITQADFDQLLCHDCAQPLKDVMCHVCCECKVCYKGECEGKCRWMVEVQPGLFIFYGSSSMFAKKHTDPPPDTRTWWQKLLSSIGL